MPQSPLAIEEARNAEARKLPACCYEDFLRLSRTLIHGPPFQWLLADAPDERLRGQVIAALDRVLRAAGLASNRLPLSGRIGDVPMLEVRLVAIARTAPVVHVIGRPGWFDASRWEAFNIRRERLATQARARLVFWLDAEALALASRAAPDLWAWRAGVYVFTAAATAPPAAAAPSGSLAPFTPFAPALTGSDPRSMAEKSRRVAEIRTWLAQHPDAPDELRVPALAELGDVLFSLGDFDEALRHWQEQVLPVSERIGDVRLKAVTVGRIADVLQARGHLEEALRIRRQDELPVYERLGDLRATAITMGSIADVLQAQGHLEESLRIRKDEQLPVFQGLGDLRSKAVTMGRIADVLQTQGQLEEALRIRQEEELPVFERIGDVRAKAITIGRIADALHSRGQLEEALRILQNDVLPVFGRLGDGPSQAWTRQKIAELERQRGQPNQRS